MGKPYGLGIVLIAAACFTVGTGLASASSTGGSPLKAVTVSSSDVVQATFELPPSMVPYSLTFTSGQTFVMFVLPGLPPGTPTSWEKYPNDPIDQPPVNFGTTTSTSWTSPNEYPFFGRNLRDGPAGTTTTWTVTLTYAPKARRAALLTSIVSSSTWTCVGTYNCPGMLQTPSYTLVTHNTRQTPPAAAP